MVSISNQQLNDLKSRMGSRIRALLEGYVSSSRGYLNILLSENSSKADRIDAAHSLKSSCALLGLDEMSSTCEDLEKKLKDPDCTEHPNIKSLIDDLKEQHRASIIYIEKEISNLSPTNTNP